MSGGRLNAQTTSVTTEYRGALHLKSCRHKTKWAITTTSNLCNYAYAQTQNKNDQMKVTSQRRSSMDSGHVCVSGLRLIVSRAVDCKICRERSWATIQIGFSCGYKSGPASCH
eukprot:scaffold161050_cov23-Prasinocladus_malaysianus.AAC.1